VAAREKGYGADTAPDPRGKVVRFTCLSGAWKQTTRHRRLVLAAGEPTAVQLSAWLCAGTDVVLTAGPVLAVTGQADM
jgi:hypothetical protein